MKERGGTRSSGEAAQANAKPASDAAATRTDLQALLQVAPSELDRRRERMLKWLPMMSWMLDRRTTAMYLLAQAAQVIEGRRWGSST